MSFQIRHVKEDEFLNIAALSLKCPPLATERNSVYHIFTKFFQNTFLVVEDDSGNIIAFLLGFISQVNPEDAYIHLLCVDPSFRRKNIASALVEEYISIVSSKGSKTIYLITGPKNKISQTFYGKLGFKPVNNDKTLKIDGISVVKDYNGPEDHKVLLYRNI